MRQSIGENFTLDVLKSFTSVNRYFKLKSKGANILLPENKGKRELIRWVDSNPKTIKLKVEIILDHLLNNTVNAINGRERNVSCPKVSDAVSYFKELISN